MAKFTIYSKDGATVRHTGEPQYSGSYMGVDYVEFRSVSSPTPIDWQIGDYVDYYRTGKRYKLYSLPMPKKVARKGDYGASLEYSNVQLHGATKELEIAPFRDLVPKDNKIHFSTRPEVSTYEDVYGIARRIQECMDDIFPDRWRIEVYDTDDADMLALFGETKEYSVSNGSCLDALSHIYETWKNVGWIHTYDSASEVDVITIGRANVRDAENTSDAFVYGIGKGLTSIKKASANEGEFATRLYVYGSERNIQTRYYNGQNILNKDSVDIRNLMLPIEKWGKTDGLPDARKAYLQADDAIVEKYGLIPRTIYFDGNKNEEIYPSIKDLTMAQVRQAMINAGQGDSEYLPGNHDYRIDEIGLMISSLDSGSKEDTEKNMTFVVGLHEMGFNLAEQGKLTSEGFATIHMKSGACAGREFKVKRYNGPSYGNAEYGDRTYTIERNWDESLGMGFPNNIYPIKSGDEFVLLDIPMPEYYITLAEDRLLEAGRKMLEDYTRVSAYYEPGINSIKIREGKILKAGMYMQVQDEDIIDTADKKDYVLIDSLTIDEKSEVPIYKVTLREQKRSARNYAALEDMIEDSREIAKKETERARQYTDRRFRSAQETLSMLEGAFKNFSEGVNPVTVRTMALLIGDESLQFKFTKGANSLEDDICPLAYDTLTKRIFSKSESYIRHMTLGIDTITSHGTRGIETYKGWKVDSFEYAFEDTDARYIYIKAREGSDSAEFVLSKTSIGMTDVVGYYHFLVGILNAEYDGSRDFVTLYGFTEVLPGQITTDVIRSADGKTYFDLTSGKIAGDITFTSSDGTSKGMADFASEVQDQIDGVVENWSAEGHPYIDSFPVSEWTTDAEKIAHINDTYVNIEAYVDDESTPTAGQAWRWCQCAEGTTPYFDIESEVTSTDWEKIGKIDPNAPYVVVQTRRNGVVLSSVSMAFDTDILVYSGLPVYIKVEKATGDVYIKDVGRYFESYPVSLRFIYSGFVSVKDKDGNEINLHWHPIADSDAVRALKDATTANRLLESVDSDNVLTGIEKHSIRESIKKITSVRYPAELLDQDYKAVGTGTFAERYNELYRKGHDSAADSIYDTLVEILLLLNNNGVWDEGNSEVEPNFRSQLETLLSDYYAYEAYGTNALSSDFDYLKETFKKGSTTVNGGLVMTDMVAVRDSDEQEVEAFLNGSGFASDTEHGKLLIAAGIEQGEADIEERSKEAKTRVYEDGHIESNDIKLKEGCVIGDTIKIYDRGILMQEEGTSALKINPVQGLTVTNTIGVSGRIGFQPVGQWLFISSPNATDLLYDTGQPIGIHIIMASTEEAIRCDSGVFAGLRPSFKKISTLGQHQISARDHTIVIGATSTGTVTLLFPDTPSHGQRYEILVASQNTTLVVTTYEVNGFDINSGAEVSSGRIYFTASSSYKRKFVFTYDASSNLWFYYYNNLTA